MTGAGHGVLPIEVHYGFGASPSVVQVRRVWQDAKGSPIELDFHVPGSPQLPETKPRCGMLPCESPEWPQHLSLKHGLDALLASPQWLTWNSAQTRTFYLSGAGFASGAGTGFGDITLDQSTIWTFEFFDFQDETRFRVQAKHLPTGGLSPAFVTEPESSRPDTLAEFYRQETFSTALATTDEAVSSIAASAGLPVEEITRLEFAVKPAVVDPDVRLAGTWSIWWGPYSGWTDYAYGSATSGQAFVILDRGV